ncbi:GFA family protein [Noviherbaspirillum saxi]|nr:GFA family protein [Noviherbaspirillum saxi]
MPIQFSGGCACGAVRYQCSATPLAMYNCHCRSCQQAGGGAYSPLIVMATAKLGICGALNRHAVQAETGGHSERCFCGRCGSPLFALSKQNPEVIVIHAASLDDPAWFKPVADIWTVSALPWVCMDRHIPKVFKSPPVLDREEKEEAVSL